MNILLATDGSSHARYTESVLAQFPFESPPDVTVVTVCPVPDLHFLGREITPAVNAVIDECRADGQKRLAEAAERCQPWAGRVQTQLLDGHPAQEIIAAAEKLTVDLVALGARGVGMAHRFLLGSVSEKAVKYANCPVLVTHHPENAVEAKLQNILIADDGSPPAQKALQRFARLDWGPDRRITVVQVLETLKEFGVQYQLGASDEWREQIDAGKRRLAADEELFRKGGPVVGSRLIEAPQAAEGLLNAAREESADLIVLGATGLSGWERLLLGSVSSRVLHAAPCSVWIERQPAESSNQTA